MKYKKLYIETLGCPKNFNDSEAAAGIWEKVGWQVCDDPLQADVIMVNTCGFIGDAKKESIDHIFDMVRLAGEREDEGSQRPVLIVSGCLSQRYGQELSDEIPEVDLFLGVNEYERLPQILKQRLEERQAPDPQKVWTGCAPEVFEELDLEIHSDTPTEGEEYGLTAALDKVKERYGMYAYVPNGRSFDLGLPDAYRNTVWKYGIEAESVR